MCRRAPPHTPPLRRRGRTERIGDVRRYVDGIAYRLDRLADDVVRDVRRMAEVVPLERRYDAHVRGLGRYVSRP